MSNEEKEVVESAEATEEKEVKASEETVEVKETEEATEVAEEKEAESEKDQKKLYTDELQDTVESMQESADKAMDEYKAHPFDTRDIVMDVLRFFAIVAIAYGWALIMLLIVSFITLSVLHIEFKNMLIWSGIFAAVIAVVYVIKTYLKYRKLSISAQGKGEKK